MGRGKDIKQEISTLNVKGMKLVVDCTIAQRGINVTRLIFWKVVLYFVTYPI